MRAIVAGVASLIAATSVAQEDNGRFPRPPSASTDRLIIKWKQRDTAVVQEQKVRQLAARTQFKLESKGQVAPRVEVMRIERRLSTQELSETIATLSADPSVEFVVPDLRRRPHALPNDTLVADQWYLLGAQTASIRAESAWDATTGSKGTVVAVLDTGVRYDHPDLRAASQGGKLLPGYDFVSGDSANSFVVANDGNGRDSDASDPGDWVDQDDLSRAGLEECETGPSSWHGTRVAGVIAASTNNNAGIAGVAWSAWILPVRVLGKCGGYDSDILAAMRWAAGLSVPGAPDNPYPAKIVNLSLGGGGTCNVAYRSVVEELIGRGVLVVASAGNEGESVSAPGNCPGVLAVTGVRHIGTKVGFSNLGPSVGIAAPGGNCVNSGPPCLFSITTTTNLGTSVPASSGYTDTFNFNVGTSFSAPMVAGTAALMHAANGRLSPAQLIRRMQQGATPFPPNSSTDTPTCQVPQPGGPDQLECHCTTQTCGAGIVNASSAVAHALRPVASIQLPTTVAPGQDVTLDASASAAACNRSIASYEWSVVSSTTGTPPAFSATNQASATVQAPASGEFTVRVTVTDDLGQQDSADVTVGPASATTTALPILNEAACPVPLSIASVAPPANPSPPTNPSPPARNGGGGGGGQLAWELVAFVLLFARRFASARSRAAASGRTPN